MNKKLFSCFCFVFFTLVFSLFLITPVKAEETFVFNKNLKLNAVSTDVLELQKFLNTHGFIVSTSGPGSVGNETTFFGSKTKTALINFQLANKITPAVGFLGPITRGVINNLISSLGISTTNTSPIVILPKIRSGLIVSHHHKNSVSSITDADVTITHGSTIFGYTFMSNGKAVTYAEAKLAPYYLNTDLSTVTLKDGDSSSVAYFKDLDISDDGTIEYEDITSLTSDFPELSFAPSEITIHLEGATSIDGGKNAWTKDVTVELMEEEYNIVFLTMIEGIAALQTSALDEDDFTPESWESFETAIASALALPETTNEEITGKIGAIMNAFENLFSSDDPDPDPDPILTDTSDITFALTTPTPEVNNTISIDNTEGSKMVLMNVENGTTSVVFTVTKLATQTITITGIASGDMDDSRNITTGGTDTEPIYTLDTTAPGTNVSMGGNKTVYFDVTEEGKNSTRYMVRVEVAYPA